ncbi:MAG TPA: hypothetical protein VK171_09370 [Fimbriimonas sp.]|nr:hypothetical protein [Fimbriimonas sp.]
MKFTKQLSEVREGSFHVLDPAKAKRMAAATMYIPSSAEVLAAISEIGSGSTLTVAQLRKKIASQHGADTACPAVVLKVWKWGAAAVETEGYPEFPWWRVTKDGKPSRHMPGGEEEHRLRLLREGVTI